MGLIAKRKRDPTRLELTISGATRVGNHKSQSVQMTLEKK